jgi:hypothetical protein
MPKREDESWINDKERDLRYCYKHKHYYRADIGCQFCGLDNVKLENELKSENNNEITLLKCPSCSKISLFWVEQTTVYECMNFKCKNVYTKEQYLKSQESGKPESLGKAWFGNEFFDTKKKKWKKP